METDFGASVAGGADMGMMANVEHLFQPMIANHWLAVLIVIVILILCVIAFFFGWIGTAVVKNKEGLKTCMEGNQSPLCRQGRDGPGESLTNAALAQGFGADANAFCKGAGDATTDPWDYLRTTVAASGEEFSAYASPADQFDQNAMIAMQH